MSRGLDAKEFLSHHSHAKEAPVPQARTLDPAASLSACLGALLRRLRAARGLTQAELGRLAGYDGSYVGAVERAAVRPSRDLVERCDHVLQADGALLSLWRLADDEWPTPPAGRADPGPATAPGSGGGSEPGGDAVVEAMELARRAEVSEVGAGALEGVERAVARLREAAAGTPPGALVPVALDQRRYVGRLLEGRLTLARRRRLLVAAGWLSVLLAQLYFDAGDREAAEANRDAALRLARQAGHTELAAWTVQALASWALADGRFGDALDLARAGQDLAPPASPAAVQLALDEAQAWTALGDRAQAGAARHQAALTRAMLPGDRSGPAASGVLEARAPGIA
jgi:tetratricopeptide (TPR) repeat protein